MLSAQVLDLDTDISFCNSLGMQLLLLCTMRIHWVYTCEYFCLWFVVKIQQKVLAAEVKETRK